MKRLLTKLTGMFAHSGSRKPRRRAGRRLGFESLEHRQMLTSVVDGTLHFDSGPEDAAHVGLAEAIESQAISFRGPGNNTGPDASDPPYTPLPGSSATYLLTGHWGGSLADAEKYDGDPASSLMCWAAAASNVLEWTGWGYVDGMTTTDEIFDYFRDHWTNDGNQPRFGWDWWFDGTNDNPNGPSSSYVDVPGGGFYPNETLPYHQEASTSDAMTAIDNFLHAGYGVTLGLEKSGSSGAHAVTVWGYDYNPSDPNEYYGVWLTDSDDHEDSVSPPDELCYYEISFKGLNPGGRWYLHQFYNSDNWSIRAVQALDRNPNHLPDLLDRGDNWSGFSPDTVWPWQPWEAHFDVRNGSSADANTSFHVDFYASTDMTITTGDHFLGRVTIPGLAAGAQADANLTLANLPPSLPSGTYYVGIIIDPTNAVAELDETNNTGIDINDYPLHVQGLEQFGVNDKMWFDRNPIGPWVRVQREMRIDIGSQAGWAKSEPMAERASPDQWGDGLGRASHVTSDARLPWVDDLAFIALDLDVL